MDIDRRGGTYYDASNSSEKERALSRLPSEHFVYIVQCADGTLYTGYARDPQKREQAHNKGRGARYTAARRPVVLVYAEPCGSVGDALRREREVKRWSRARKETLIARNART